MSSLFVLYIFILGLFLGSFLNVLIDRIPKKQPVVFGRSYCDSCHRKLAWYDLIPVFSFIFLKGKCRFCRFPLSFYYPIVELLTGIILFILVAFSLVRGFTIYDLRFTNLISLGYYLFIFSSLIVVFFTDLKYGIIPDKIIFPAVAVSFLFLFLNLKSLFLNHLWSGLGAFLFFLILLLVTRGRGMGFGDIKLAFLLGIFLGFPKIIFALYIAFLTGALSGIILILCKRKKFFGATIPFGPFLVLGTILSIFLEKDIIKLLHWLNFW